MQAPPPVPGCRIDAPLGEGATGTVYAAVNSHGEDIAIKFLRASLSDDPEMVARFRREASVCQKLRSEFIAQVVGAGRTEGTYWIAYRRLHGETLSDRLKRELVLDPSRLVPLIEHVLGGLAVAHAAGIVHRDIKPANVMIERTEAGDRACILDFGISKNRNARPSADGSGTWHESLTSATATLGTINYMPPEQVGGSAAVDHRADLYAVGVVAYRALTGQLPYVGTSQAAVLHAKLEKDARSLKTATGVAWPRPVEAFFSQVLARNTARRFPDAERMAAAWLATSASPLPELGVLRRLSADSEESDDTVLEGS